MSKRIIAIIVLCVFVMGTLAACIPPGHLKRGVPPPGHAKPKPVPPGHAKPRR